MIKIKQLLVKKLLLFTIIFSLLASCLNAFMVRTTECIAAEKEKTELHEQIKNLKQNEIENKKLLQQIEQLKQNTKDVEKIEQILEKISDEPGGEEAKELDKQNKKLKNELSQATQNLQKVNKDKRTQDRQLDGLKKELDKIKKDNNQRVNFKKEIGKLKSEKKVLENKVEEQENKKKTSVNKLVGKLEKMNVSQKYIDKMKQKLTRSPQIEDEYNNMIENLLTKSVRSLPIEYLLEDLTELE